MIVISDTSCIGYLIIIDRLSLLKENFSEIIIPQIVHHEILQLSSKYNLNKYLNADGIKRRSIKNIQLQQQLFTTVDEGESEAFVLAKEIQADLLLIDERKGASLARSLGIVRPILDQLISRTTFRIDKTLYENVLKQANEQ